MEDTCLGCSVSDTWSSWRSPVLWLFVLFMKLPRFHRLVFLYQYIVFLNQYTQWKSLKQSDYNQAPTQLFVKTGAHWSTADIMAMCVQPISSLLAINVRLQSSSRQSALIAGSGVILKKLQWLDEFGQGVRCAWESSRDFSKILGLLAGRRFLRGPIILPWVEFKSRDQSSSFVWQGAATSATWRCLWWRDR